MGELIEKEFKKGKLRIGHIKNDYLIFDFEEIDSIHFDGVYKKGKRWEGEGEELYPNKMKEFEG